MVKLEKKIVIEFILNIKIKMEEIFELIEDGDEMRKFSDYFQFIKLLGRGAFGVVVHAQNLTTN